MVARSPLPRIGMHEERATLEEVLVDSAEVAVAARGIKDYRITVDLEAPLDKPHVLIEVELPWWKWIFARLEMGYDTGITLSAMESGRVLAGFNVHIHGDLRHRTVLLRKKWGRG